MKWRKLTAFALSTVMITLASCESEQETFDENYYENNSIVMSGTNEVPSVTTTGTGSVKANYSKLSRILNYTVSFSGLSANATAAHIHGTAEPGVNAGILQTFNNFPLQKQGTYTGTLFLDGVKLKEEDLLAGRYYVNIHTSTNTGGEIRGQLILAQ